MCYIENNMFLFPDSSDYSSSLFYLVSSSGANVPLARRFCVSVMAVADGIVENHEFADIVLNFAAPSPDRIILQPNKTRVQILDTDGMININLC